MRAEESAGCTVVCVAGDGRLLGIAAVSDKLKEEACRLQKLLSRELKPGLKEAQQEECSTQTRES